MNGFKNKPSYEFIGETTVIFKINLVWDVKTSEKSINNRERVFIACKNTR